MRNGARVEIGVKAPGMAEPAWQWATVGCVARAHDDRRYFITARHAVGDIYRHPPPYDLATCEINMRTKGQVFRCASVVRPQAATVSGCVVDAVAITLPEGVVPDVEPGRKVVQGGELPAFEGLPGFALVDRNGDPAFLSGTIRLIPSGVSRIINYQGEKYEVVLPPLVRLDFSDPKRSTESGDSGAPILSDALGPEIGLLGFHFYEDYEDHDEDKPYSLATAAYWVLDTTHLDTS